MTKNEEREVQRKLRVLQHAKRTGQVTETCRYFMKVTVAALNPARTPAKLLQDEHTHRAYHAGLLLHL
jgi:hypothetical protein